MGPGEMPRRMRATWASKTLRTGRGKSVGDWREIVNGLGAGLAGATTFGGAIFLGCLCCQKNQVPPAMKTNKIAQPKIPAQLVFERLGTALFSRKIEGLAMES